MTRAEAASLVTGDVVEINQNGATGTITTIEKDRFGVPRVFLKPEDCDRVLRYDYTGLKLVSTQK